MWECKGTIVLFSHLMVVLSAFSSSVRSVSAQERPSLPVPAAHLLLALGTPYSFRFEHRTLQDALKEITSKSHVPIVVADDARSKLTTKLALEIPEMPLASGLQVLLAEVDLLYFLTPTSIKVAADPTLVPQVESMTWVSNDPALMKRVQTAFATPVTYQVEQRPLRLFVMDVADAMKLPVTLDLPELEANRINLDEPVTIQVEDVPARYVLTAVLDRLQLEAAVIDGRLVVTSEERAAHKTLVRIYWLDRPAGQSVDMDSCLNLIRSIIESETWIDYGGRSKMEPHNQVINALIRNRFTGWVVKPVNSH